MFKFNKLFFALLVIIIANSAYSQGTLRGFIYEKDNGEPVIFTNVYLEKSTYGAATDVNGYFNISNIKEGNYNLMVTYIGYDTLKEPVSIKNGQLISKKLYLTKSSIQLNNITISGERQDLKEDVRISTIKVTIKQIEQVPTIGAEPDFAQYLQVLPGVIFTGDQGGQLYIRGGSPIQNKVLLDGMVIFNPFHSIGLFSVFDADIIRNADVYTGGFNAEYSGRISSVMDITTRDGNKKKYSGKVSASPFGSKLLLEGPLKKLTETSKNSSSFILSAKNSYLEESSKFLYSYIDTSGLPFNFTDLYGKLSINADNGSKVNFFGFKFSDRVKYKALSNFNWDTWGAGFNAVVVPSGSNALIKTNFSFSNYKITLNEEKQKEKSSLINGYNLGLTFVYFFDKNELNYGLETSGTKTSYSFYNSIGRNISQDQNTTELGAFVKYKWVIKNFLIEPGFRLQYYASLPQVSPEPRLGVKYNVKDNFRIKFAGGVYSQNLISANSDRDVVNLFYGFLSGPELGDLQDSLNGKKVNTALQKSIHAILGFEYDLTDRISTNIEGYFKDNTQLTNTNRNKIYDDISTYNNKPDYFKKDFVLETGLAYGVDFVVKYDHKRTYVWLVYSLGYITRDDGYIQYAPNYDRRHNINLVASQIVGKNLNWEFSARWNYGSGFPFTQTQGYYESNSLANGINTNYATANGQIGILYGDLNGGKLPDYHRLDINIKYTVSLSINSKLEATLSVTNVYNRKNIFYFDRLTHKRVDQLPIMPSAGISLTF